MEPMVIAIAFIAGLLFSRFGYPPLLGYLLAGFFANFLGLGSADTFAPLADAGILLLLFTIGLKLNVRELKPRYVWGSALLHMVIAIPLTTAVIYVVGMMYAPLSFEHPAAPWTLAFAMSFSSTVLAIKLFEERGDTTSIYASIAIGILVVQDVLAVIYLVATADYLPTPWALLLLGLPLLLPFIRKILPIVGHGELLLLAGIVFAFCAAALFEFVDLKGGLGALLMGMLLGRADRKKAKEMYDQLAGLKNLLLIGFFIQIGYYGIPSLELVYVAIVLGCLITLRPLIYFGLLTAFGLRARTSWFSALSLYTYSEFGLIVTVIAQEAGILGDQWLTTVALAMAFSYVIATPINRKAHELYIRYCEKLRRHEREERLPIERIGSIGDATIAIMGMGRVGRGAFDALRDAGHTKVIGVEEKYAIAIERTESGWPCINGDALDRDFWEHTGMHNCELIMVSLSNHSENMQVAKLARQLNYKNVLAVSARFPDEAAELEAMGCIAFYLYRDVGRDFASHTLNEITASLDKAGTSRDR